MGDLGFAALQATPGSTILVAPGTYATFEIRRVVDPPITIRSAQPYAARLEDQTVIFRCYTCAGWTVEGFELAQTRSAGSIPIVQISAGAARVVLRNNIVHDAAINAAVRVVDSTEVVVARNLIYNTPSQLVHVADSSAVTVEDNLVFSDFAASGGAGATHGPMIWLERAIGAGAFRVRRNVLMRWEGRSNEAFVQVTAIDGDTIIENNLIVGDGTQPTQAVLRLEGTRAVTFRHNTVVGDFPGMTLIALASWLGTPTRATAILDNIWSDPTGSMTDFADAAPADVQALQLDQNLYWNGGVMVPDDPMEAVRPIQDGGSLFADPRLAATPMPAPVWQIDRFADGSRSICDAFARAVAAYAELGPGSAAAGAASSSTEPAHDILGRPRAVPKSIGSIEPR